MGCTDSGRVTELEFVNRLANHPPAECIGPVIEQELFGYYLGLMEEAIESTAEHDRLWDNFSEGDDGPVFDMCLFHWMNLAYQLRRLGVIHRRQSWVTFSLGLLARVSADAGIDPKEISNLLIWRRVLLT